MELNRRGFLGWSAVGLTGLLVPELVRPRAKVFDMGRSSGMMRVPGLGDLGWVRFRYRVYGREYDEFVRIYGPVHASYLEFGVPAGASRIRVSSAFP